MAKRRSDGTGEWFLQTKEYRAWSVSAGGKLWVNARRTSSAALADLADSYSQEGQGKRFWRE